MSINQSLSVKKLHFVTDYLSVVKSYLGRLQNIWGEKTDSGDILPIAQPHDEELLEYLPSAEEAERVMFDTAHSPASKPGKREREYDEPESVAKKMKMVVEEDMDLPALPIELSTPKQPYRALPSFPGQSPSMSARIKLAYQTAANRENFHSPTEKRLASATILREFGERIDEAIHSSSESQKDYSLFEKLRKHIREVAQRDAAFEKRNDIDIHTFIIKFGSANSSVTSHHKVYKSGITSHQVTGINSYESIAKQLRIWSEKVPDKIIADTIWDIISDREFTHKFDLSKRDQKKFVDFLTKLTFLLFCTESVREPASIAVNAMFLDLVKSGDYKMEDIIKLPMSAENAVPATRTLSKKALGVLDPSSPVRKDPKLHNPKVQNLLDNYESILYNWLKANSGGKILLINRDHQQISDLITAKIIDWFSLEIKPFRDSLPAALDDNPDEVSSDPESGYDSPIPTFDLGSAYTFKEDEALIIGDIAE